MEKQLRKAHGAMHRSLKCLDNKVLKTILYLLVIAGAICLLIGCSLPQEICNLSNNNIVRVLAVLLVVYIGVKDLTLAVLLAISFILLVRACNHTQMFGSAGSGYVTSGDMDNSPAPENIFADQAAMPSPSVSEEEDAVYRQFIESQVENNDVIGYNSNETDECLQLCATDGSLPSDQGNDQCSAVATWNNELNAQGLNCPMGDPSTPVGAPF